MVLAALEWRTDQATVFIHSLSWYQQDDVIAALDSRRLELEKEAEVPHEIRSASRVTFIVSLLDFNINA